MLLRVDSESEIETTDGSVLHLKANDMIHVSPGLVDCDNPNTPADKQMEYGVTDYDGKTKEERGGKYKGELLENPDSGWQLSLIEDSPDLGERFFARRNSFVPTEIGGRREIVGKKDNNEYLKLFSGNSDEGNSYQGEGGQTPESAIVTSLTYLLEDKIVIDDYDSTGLANLLVGTRLPAGTPLFYLNKGAKMVVFYVIGPKEKASKGVRSAVAF
jgi:hypothetical protein